MIAKTSSVLYNYWYRFMLSIYWKYLLNSFMNGIDFPFSSIIASYYYYYLILFFFLLSSFFFLLSLPLLDELFVICTIATSSIDIYIYIYIIHQTNIDALMFYFSEYMHWCSSFWNVRILCLVWRILNSPHLDFYLSIVLLTVQNLSILFVNSTMIENSIYLT